MLFLSSLVLIALHAISAGATPNPQTLGVEFASTSNSLPILTLPYGRWRAASYDSVNDVYLPRKKISLLEQRG
jgi:hypothetical protein